MFTCKVMVTKMSKMTFFVFSADDCKIVTIWSKVHLKDLLELFQKIVWLLGFVVTVREKSRVKISKKVPSQQEHPRS